MGNSIVLDQYSTAEEYTNVLRGRYVTSVTVADDDGCAPLEAIFTLDNGITLVAHGNEGCAACGNDWYYIEKAFACGSAQARIMSAHVKHDEYGFEDVTPFSLCLTASLTSFPLWLLGVAATATTGPGSP